jgi:hypothetical protein
VPDFLGANVHSLDALRDVRAALVRFQERAITAMGDLRQKIDRTVDWLELDRPGYWREQERKAYDQVAATRIAYETCRLRTVGGRRSDCIEEKKAFERAKVRLQYVHQKQEAVVKWVVHAGRDANEYRARTSNFQRALDNDVALMIAQIGRMIDALEAYTETNADRLAATASSQSAEGDMTDATSGQAEVHADQDADSTAIDHTDALPRTDSHD